MSSFAQSTAALLPQGKIQFLDNNGNPLTSGKVYFYIPSTTTTKTTWQDSGKTIANANPVVLDAGGRAIIYGDGTYRQQVRDRNNNLIYDVLTASAGTGGGTTGTGDGDLVGTIKPWAGLVAPNQYVFAYGQELSRTTYSVLFTALTSTQPVTCTSGNSILAGLSDTSQIPTGAVIETICAPAGSTVVSKTSTTVTLNQNATVTTVTTAVFFLYGNGNGSTTFNVPDLRGYVIAGRTNMGGIASSNLTSTYLGTNPQATGAKGGNQSGTLVTANLPAYTPSGTISQITPAGNNSTSNVTNVFSSSGTNTYTPAGTNASSTVTNTFSTSGTNTYTPAGTNSTPTVNVTNGANILTVNGVGPFNATAAGAAWGPVNGVTVTAALSGAPVFSGTASTLTSSAAGQTFTGDASTLTSTASSQTFTGTPVTPTFTGTAQGGTSTAFSLIQPTQTLNYIIKVTPDSNSADASGVTSIQGMTGDIACGTGLTCTGNIISVNVGTGVTSFGGASGAITFSAGSGLSMTGNALTPYIYQASSSINIDVDHANGSDVPSCGFAPTTSACQTIYYAYLLAQTTRKPGLGGLITISNAAETFTETPSTAFLGPSLTGGAGGGVVFITAKGGGANWNTGGIIFDDGSVVSISNFTFDCTGVGNTALNSAKMGLVVLGSNLAFRNGCGAHMQTFEGGIILADAGYSITGNVNYHVISNSKGQFNITGKTISIPVALVFSGAVVSANQGAFIGLSGATFSGAGIAGTTGLRYDNSTQSTMQCGDGNNCNTKLPGNVVGTFNSNACVDTVCITGTRFAFAGTATCATEIRGARATITDSNTNVWGANIAGGGGNIVGAFCNGANWTVESK